MRNRILRLGMSDVVSYIRYVLPFIMLFEAYMIAGWFVYTHDRTAIGAVGYLACYITLFAVTAATYVYLIVAGRKVEQNYRTIAVVQYLYAVFVTVWATAFTYIGSEYRNSFDYLLFVTTVTLVPVFCFLKPLFWLSVHLACSAVMFYLASHHPHFSAFCINFTFFVVCSVAAGWTMFKIRKSNYKELIELEEERNLADTLAHRDSLTGLYNRHTHSKDARALLNMEVLPQDLVVAIFDVNGLKQVNDKQGHAAGDELIRGAAQCMKTAFESYGRVYRYGGDEFTALLRCDSRQLDEALRHFEQLTAEWRGSLVHSVSVAVGIALAQDHPDITLESLITMADDDMYANKQAHYQRNATTAKGVAL